MSSLLKGFKDGGILTVKSIKINQFGQGVLISLKMSSIVAARVIRKDSKLYYMLGVSFTVDSWLHYTDTYIDLSSHHYGYMAWT